MTEEQPQEQETQEQESEPLIDENGVAVSPHEKYPGELRFPITKLGKVYKTFMPAIARTKDDPIGDLFRLVPNWRGAIAVAEFDIEGVEPTEAAFDDLDPAFTLWVSNCVGEYYANFLMRGR